MKRRQDTKTCLPLIMFLHFLCCSCFYYIIGVGRFSITLPCLTKSHKLKSTRLGQLHEQNNDPKRCRNEGEDELISSSSSIKSCASSNIKNVLSGIDTLYPPNYLPRRTSTSRSDGYWAYLEDGKDPPKHFTYGEFDFIFFVKALKP